MCLRRARWLIAESLNNLILEYEFEIEYDAGKPGISIDVEISSGAISVVVPTKLDTGSTRCIFARRFGEEIGLQIEDGEPQVISTPTGTFRAYGHAVSITTAEYTFDSQVLFAENEVFNQSVLGRHGWLDRVIVGIKDYDGKLYLNLYNR